MNSEQIKNIVENYKTPLYVFDIGEVHRRIDCIRKHLPEDVAVCYAIKANTFITKEINEYVDRFEVCSPGEAYICQRLGIPTNKIVISGVYKTPSFIEKMISDNAPDSIYTIESLEQFELIKSAAKKNDSKVKILIRVTSGNQFGLDEDHIRNIIKDNINDDNLDIEGLQFYSGTQKTSVKKLRRELTHLDELMMSLRDEYGFETRELEFGPGLPVCYFLSEEFDEDSYLQEFSQMLSEMQYRTKITLEFGRGIAATCGTYLTSIVDRKENKGQKYAIVDGGIHQLVYFGQSMAMKHPVFQVYPDKRDSDIAEEWNICGSLCTVNDILVKQLPVKDLQVGEILVFNNTGAYSMTEGISLFLSRELPNIVLLTENGTTVLVRDDFGTDILNMPKYEREK